MKHIYSCSKPALLFVIFLFFLCQYSQNSYGQCASCSDGPPEGLVESCDDFESYTVGKTLPLEKNNWRPWGSSANLPTILSFDGSKVIHMGREGITRTNPDVLYHLGNKTTGRYRLSWRLYLNKDKKAYFALLHNTTDPINTKANENLAYEVFVNTNGAGYVRIGDQNVSARDISFNCKKEAWNQFMQIIDISQNRIEFWVNGDFITSWKFNRGETPSSNLGRLSFWNQDSTMYSYYVDNVCFLKKNTGSCSSNSSKNPVCVKNGASYSTAQEAQCDLYTNAEYENGLCERVCDYARKFLDIDAPALKDTLKRLGIPNSVATSPCVSAYFGLKGVHQLYSDVFAFKIDFGARVSVTWKTPPGVKSKAFVFSCSCEGRFCTQSCFPEDRPMQVAPTGEHLIKYQVPEKGFYYVVLMSDSLVDYSNFYISFCAPNVIPLRPDQAETKSTTLAEGCGVCRTINPIILSCNTTYFGDFQDKEGQFNRFSQPYDNCSGASQRAYEGSDAVHKFIVDVPSFVSVTLDGKTSPMGMFLYDYACGVHCLDVSETSAQGGTASFAPIFLNPGEYYIIVDKDLMTGNTANNQYTLTLKCEDSSNQDFVSDTNSCPKNGTTPHQVRIRSVGALMLNNLSLTLKDRISFVYDKGQNNYFLEKGLFWNGQELVYNFFADKSGDLDKCGYAAGDSFQIRIANEGRIKSVRPVFEANSPSVYSSGAISTITRFEAIKENSFFISPSSHRTGFGAEGQFSILLQAEGTSWKISKIPSWLSIADSSGTGSADLTFTTKSANNSNRNRIAEIYITNTEKVLRTFYAIQKGCTAAAADLGADLQVCVGEPLVLKPLVQGTFRWGNNATTSTLTVNTSTPGTTSYTIRAVNGTCIATDTVKVTVNAKPIFDLGPEKNICLGDSVQLTASGGGTYLWSQSNATNASIFVKPASTNTYSVTVTKDGCQSSDQISVKVNPKPIANAGQDQTICSGAKTVLSASGGGTYTWSTGFTAAQFEVSPTVTTTYTLTVTTQSGCTTSDQVVVVVNRATANAGNDRTICRGSSTILQASGGGTYLWSGGETTSSIMVSPDTNKDYQVTVSNNNCSATASVKVTVIPLPQASAGLPQTICRGQSAILSASGGGTYLWNTSASTQQITVSPTQSTDYTVTVTKDGCSNSAKVRVTVNSATANAGPDQSICAGQIALLTASGGSTYKWSNNATTTSIAISPTATQVFTVTVTQNDCEAIDQVTITVNPNPSIKKDSSQFKAGVKSFIAVSVSGGKAPYQYQWFRNDTLISTREDLTGLKTGIYKLAVSDANGCTAGFAPELFIITSTRDAAGVVDLKIYPNPTQGQVRIEGKLKKKETVQVRLLEATGKYIWKSDIKIANEFLYAPDLSTLAPGIYIIQLDVSGTLVYRKLIVQ